LDALNDDCHAGVVIEAVQQEGNNDADTTLTEPSSQSSRQLIFLEVDDSMTDADKKQTLPIKRKNDFILSQFACVNDLDAEILIFTCIHCRSAKRWQRFNATFATQHITSQCKAVPVDIKEEAANLTQASRKKAKALSLISQSSSGLLSKETSRDLVHLPQLPTVKNQQMER